MSRSLAILMLEARHALDVSQNGFAGLMGVSRRTGQRWTAAGGPPSYELAKMATIVFPADPSLAAEIAARAGTSLEALGLVKPAPPPAPPPPAPAPAPPAAPPRVPDRAVDAVVCAAAEAMQCIPQTVRPALLAACTCAKELGLTLDDLERVLRAKPRTARTG